MNKIDLSSTKDIWSRIKELRRNDICDLAPRFREKVNNMLVDCSKIKQIEISGVPFIFDPIIFETSRVNELQKIYYSQGTTNARHAFFSWHFYGLAIDVISKTMNWDVPMQWWKELGEIAKKHNLKWGGDWSSRKDFTHIQWGSMRDSPKDAPNIYFNTKTIVNYNQIEDPYEHQLGIMRVWKVVGAI